MGRRKKKKYESVVPELTGNIMTIGIASAVGAGIGAAAPAGTPSVTAGFNTMAGFMPTMVTAGMGLETLRYVDQYKKYYKKKKR